MMLFDILDIPVFKVNSCSKNRRKKEKLQESGNYINSLEVIILERNI